MQDPLPDPDAPQLGYYLPILVRMRWMNEDSISLEFSHQTLFLFPVYGHLITVQVKPTFLF